MAISGVADLTGRVLAARYRVLAPIGAGASGRVYVADDTRLRRRVAVKVLHAGLADDAGFLRRFRTEAQVAASLHHPNIMAVYDWGDDDVPFMVLELLRGGSLRGVLDAGARCTPAQAVHVGRQVTAALEYAHARGIVHRDIKPANLLFDEHGIVRVADFGLARALAEASWTEPAGAVVGTARYAAPEQATGAPLDGRADLYALAVVLSEAVTGTVPGVAETAIGTLAVRSHTALVAPLELGRLGPVVERAGRPDPAERYPDAATMGAALADAARALPPPTPLALAGLGGDVSLADPTRIGRSAALFDQDASDVPAPTPIDPVARGDHHRPRASRVVGTVVAVAVVMAVVAGGLAIAATGVGTVAVPSVVGRTAAEAEQVLDRAGLVVRTVTRTADDPAGIVIGQGPAAGAYVESGATVRLVVSRGPPPVTVTDVTGQPVADATAVLSEQGFAVEVQRRTDENVPFDAVIATDPPAGSAQPRESTVTVVVSDGPAPVRVPDVTGAATYEAAAASLAQSRFTAARAPDEFSATVETGKVIRTDPAPGALAPRDSTVTVVVSKGPELVEVPASVIGKSLDVAQAQLQGLGFEVDTVSYLPGRGRAIDDARARCEGPEGHEGHAHVLSRVTHPPLRRCLPTTGARGPPSDRSTRRCGMRRPPHGATARPGPARPAAGYGRPLGRPGPQAGLVPDDGTDGGLSDGLGGAVFERLGGGLGDPVLDGLGGGLGGAVFERLGGGLGVGLGDPVSDRLGGAPDDGGQAVISVSASASPDEPGPTPAA